MKILEDNVERSLLQEEENLSTKIPREQVPERPKSDVGALIKRFEIGLTQLFKATEVESLRKKLADAEMRHARTVHDVRFHLQGSDTLLPFAAEQGSVRARDSDRSQSTSLGFFSSHRMCLILVVLRSIVR